MTKCTKCKIEKPPELFNKNKRTKSGLSSWCKSCHKAACMSYAADDPIRYKWYNHKSQARKRNIEYSLTFEQFESLWNKDCIYCGDKIDTTGIDRIDSSIGYHIGNVQSCCFYCNSAKLDQTEEEFFIRIKKIAARIR